jgi:hypothetical protein
MMNKQPFFSVNKSFALLLILVLSVGFLLSACTKEITLDLPKPTDKLVVEGNIEANSPPFVILTKNSPYFGGINLNDIGKYFVKDADKVWVYDDFGDTSKLQKLCISNAAIAKQFGYDFSGDSTVPELCIYTIPDVFTWFTTGRASFTGKVNRDYHLYIEAEGKKVSSTTHIPDFFPFDSLQVRHHPKPENDSLKQLYLYLTFPTAEGHYVRLQTKRNSEPYYAPPNGSTFEYKVFLGQSTGLPVSRGQAPGAEFDQNTFGYFWKGDTVSVSWSQIDKSTFDFYSTLENDGGDSPFSAPVKIVSNIKGGLGVWAGTATTYGSIVIPR